MWKARFAPGETGNWTYTYVFTNFTGGRVTGSGAFECVKGRVPLHGSVRPSPGNPYRWVFDDGTHVYIQMPEAMRVTEAPALFVHTRAGDVVLVNYRLRQQYFVVDKLFDSAVLLLGVGDRQERVTIRRLAPRR